MDGEVCNLSRANLRGNDGCMGDYENNEGRLSFSKTVGGSEKYKECGTPLISWPFELNFDGMVSSPLCSLGTV